MLDKVDLAEKFGMISEYWQPRVVGDLNGQYVKIAKLKGEFVWHHHENEDELFYVFRGRLVIKLKDRDVLLDQGQFFIIPRGVEHMPVAETEVEVVLFEPKTVINTGNVVCERTIAQTEPI
jgi:mannose-6-phosphate isomerase-like protein (cupin superfamily)